MQAHAVSGGGQRAACSGQLFGGAPGSFSSMSVFFTLRNSVTAPRLSSPSRSLSSAAALLALQRVAAHVAAQGGAAGQGGVRAPSPQLQGASGLAGLRLGSGGCPRRGVAGPDYARAAHRLNGSSCHACSQRANLLGMLVGRPSRLPPLSRPTRTPELDRSPPSPVQTPHRGAQGEATRAAGGGTCWSCIPAGAGAVPHAAARSPDALACMSLARVLQHACCSPRSGTPQAALAATRIRRSDAHRASGQAVRDGPRRRGWLLAAPPSHSRQ